MKIRAQGVGETARRWAWLTTLTLASACGGSEFVGARVLEPTDAGDVVDAAADVAELDQVDAADVAGELDQVDAAADVVDEPPPCDLRECQNCSVGQLPFCRARYDDGRGSAPCFCGNNCPPSQMYDAGRCY